MNNYSVPEPAHRARPPHPTRTLAPSSTHDRAVPQRPVFSPTTERFPHSPARRCDAPPGRPREPRFTAPPGVSLRPPRPASPVSAIRCAAGVRAARRAAAPAPVGPSQQSTVAASTRAFAQCSRAPPGREQIPTALPPPVPDAAAPPDGTLPPPAVAPPSRLRSPPPTELPPPSSRSVLRHRSAVPPVAYPVTGIARRQLLAIPCVSLHSRRRPQVRTVLLSPSIPLRPAFQSGDSPPAQEPLQFPHLLLFLRLISRSQLNTMVTAVLVL